MFQKKGFTLLETVIAVGVTSLFFGAVAVSLRAVSLGASVAYSRVILSDVGQESLSQLVLLRDQTSSATSLQALYETVGVTPSYGALVQDQTPRTTCDGQACLQPGFGGPHILTWCTSSSVSAVCQTALDRTSEVSPAGAGGQQTTLRSQLTQSQLEYIAVPKKLYTSTNRPRIDAAHPPTGQALSLAVSNANNQRDYLLLTRRISITSRGDGTFTAVVTVKNALTQSMVVTSQMVLSDSR